MCKYPKHFFNPAMHVTRAFRIQDLKQSVMKRLPKIFLCSAMSKTTELFLDLHLLIFTNEYNLQKFTNDNSSTILHSFSRHQNKSLLLAMYLVDNHQWREWFSLATFPWEDLHLMFLCVNSLMVSRYVAMRWDDSVLINHYGDFSIIMQSKYSCHQVT